MVMSALSPAKTVVSAGTAQRTVVVGVDPPPPPPVAASGAPPEGGAAAAVAGGVVIVRPVHVNGAGPPFTVTVADSGRATRRYCSSGDRVAVAEKVDGATAPTTSPIAT